METKRSEDYQIKLAQ